MIALTINGKRREVDEPPDMPFLIESFIDDLAKFHRHRRRMFGERCR